MPSTSPYIVSTALPTLADLQAEIDELTRHLASLTSNPFIGGARRPQLEKQLKAKQSLFDQLKSPSDRSGVPPAPEAPPILGSRIETPKVGLDDLKIFLQR